jgi:GTP-binding protein
METTHSIRFADVVVLVMDPVEAFEKQDVQIANLVLREGRGLVFAITKWDTVDAPGEARKEMEHQAKAHLPQAEGAPVVMVSGVTRRNLDKLMDACLKVHKDWSARVKTRDLNDWLHYVIQKNPPPAPGGKRIKPRYMAQMKTRPPTFVLMASRAEEMPETYKRYLINELREAFDLPGVPIRLVLRQGKNPFTDKRE